MSYRIVWEKSVLRAVKSWSLPDAVLVEMHLRAHALAHRPADRLSRLTVPFDGMVYAFEFIDPNNRICEHLFAFRVAYSQDEEVLHIVQGRYVRRFA